MSERRLAALIAAGFVQEFGERDGQSEGSIGNPGGGELLNTVLAGGRAAGVAAAAAARGAEGARKYTYT